MLTEAFLHLFRSISAFLNTRCAETAELALPRSNSGNFGRSARARNTTKSREPFRKATLSAVLERGGEQLRFYYAIPLLLVLTLSGCSAKKPLPPAQWDFQPAAITVSFKADPRLNLYAGTPHALVLCFYQLTEPNAFNMFAQTEQGLSDLLACNRFDQSVVNFRRVMVQPGSEQKLLFDRAENARHLGIVAGYFTLNRKNTASIFKIPVVIEEKGFFSKTRMKKPGKLQINLILGPTGMKATEVNSES